MKCMVGQKKYEDDMREVTRKNLSIEQYMNNLREEYVKESGEETGMGDFDQKWYEKRKEIEQKFVKAEEIHKVK